MSRLAVLMLALLCVATVSKADAHLGRRLFQDLPQPGFEQPAQEQPAQPEQPAQEQPAQPAQPPGEQQVPPEQAEQQISQAIAAQDPQGFTQAVESAGPEASANAMATAITNQQSENLVNLISQAGDQPTVIQAFTQGLAQVMCTNTEAAGQALGEAMPAEGQVPLAAAQAVSQSWEECCQETAQAVASASEGEEFSEQFVEAMEQAAPPQVPCCFVVSLLQNNGAGLAEQMVTAGTLQVEGAQQNPMAPAPAPAQPEQPAEEQPAQPEQPVQEQPAQEQPAQPEQPAQQG